MSGHFTGACLVKEGKYDETKIYRLQGEGLHNRYHIISGPGSRRLLASPETVGFDCYQALVDETTAALSQLLCHNASIDIFTILRGGLNYPLEEAAAKCGIKVRDIHFVSCERIINHDEILGLDVRYEKIRPSKNRILAIGDILATGDTLRLCLEHLVSEFQRKEGSLRRILLFTIGGTRAIQVLEELYPKILEVFPQFEGFDCCFFEGMFTVYTDKGVSGINTPDIDFGWKGGVVSPEFRKYIIERPDALYEKCIIYDGGARRFELQLHFEEVLEYWEGILERADKIDAVAMTGEKLGYDTPLSYDEWARETHLAALGDYHLLWEKEQELLRQGVNLRELALRRIQAMKQIQKEYET